MRNQLELIINNYGIVKQMTIWIEELSELQKVICKWNRVYDKNNAVMPDDIRKQFVTELADVENIIDQIKICTEIKDSEIYEERKLKNNRQLNRITVENNRK